MPVERPLFVSMDSLLDEIQLKKTELEQCGFLAALARALKPYAPKPTEIRFLAVGSFSDGPNSAYQTAAALWLAEFYGAGKITAWDPNFKKKDLRALSELGIQVKEKDPEKVDNVLFFVPHAPYFLEPQLLKRVKNSVYIGNDLKLNAANTTRDARELEWYTKEAQITPLKVKPKDAFFDAFKNTAVHQLKV